MYLEFSADQVPFGQ